jgi:para-aminobenzoate synthetase component 1
LSWVDRKRISGISQAQIEGILEGSELVLGITGQPFLEVARSPIGFKFSKLIAVGAKHELVGKSGEDIEKLKRLLTNSNDFVFGYFNYDFRVLLEDLPSSNPDSMGFRKFHFFVPETLFVFDGSWTAFSHSQLSLNEKEKSSVQVSVGSPFESPDRKKFSHTIENIKQHIQFGDVYELNYCIQHGFSETQIEPLRLLDELQFNSPAPFSCFVRDRGHYLFCASPERFVKKVENKVISQPIKGTNKRLTDNADQIETLRNDPKEVAENVMITDLVRNDLSRTAKKGTVKVDELCGVYEFEHVNQMISTVSSELKDEVHPLDAILNAFPMGSMTGAPKIRAMELIDQYEDFARGLYSGSVGYFTPDLDFDFNVVIRSILYNEREKVVTFPTGGAITIQSDPDSEYDECMLKAEAMRNVLLNHAK